MNYSFKLTLLFIAFISNIILSQTEIILNEGKVSEICGKIVIFDGIWISAGQQFADISVLENERSKPITGGYKKYDKIEINNCTYYITAIYKNGINPTGTVKLSSKITEMSETVMFGKVELTNNDMLYSNDSLSKISIYKESTGKPAILTGYEENSIGKKVVLIKGSVIWYEGYPFELTKISLKKKTAEFLIMKTYSYGK